jgi:mono/diheme cytochrome c family protein
MGARDQMKLKEAAMLIARRVLRHLINAAVFLSLTTAAHSQDIANGKQIAALRCGGCHGTSTPNGTVIEGVSVPSFSEVARRANRDSRSLESLIMIPHRPMSAPQLQASEIRDVVSYILSLD